MDVLCNNLIVECGFKMKVPFYQSVWFTVAMLIVLPPLGIYLALRYSRWSIAGKAAASVLSALWFIILLAAAFSDGGTSDDPSTSDTAAYSKSYFQSAEYAESEPVPQTEPSTAEPSSAARPTEAERSTVRATEPPTTEKKKPETPETPADDPPQNNIGYTYVLNTNTKKYHRPSCRDVRRIKPENYATSSTVPPGYSPCGHCHP
ncbi:MAG TPA: hypothetical protein IAB39_08305 [Candidatus Onthovicinus excrementipullorum]|nr:hypothetical protein [Candidatus Onthovicinus excrementipullorum]